MGLEAFRATDAMGACEILPAEATGWARALDFGHRYIQLYT